MKFTRLKLLVFTTAFLAAGAARAGLPAMPEIPVTLPDSVRQPLIVKRAPLAQQKMTLIDEGKLLNQQCASIVQGSQQHQACLDRQKAFNDKVEILRADFNALSVEIDAAIAADNRRLAAINRDPMVVDARVPRDGAWLTAQVPELANSPAADRINKGFQAVINHDWQLALVWWQEALQRDPGNAALQRSVDLALWMVNRRKAVAAGSDLPLSQPVPAGGRLQLPKDSDVLFLFPGEPSAPPQKQPIFQVRPDGSLKQLLRDTDVPESEPIYVVHPDGTLMQVPKRSDSDLFLFGSKQESNRQVKNTPVKSLDEKWTRDFMNGLYTTGMNRLSIGDEAGAETAFRTADMLSESLSANPPPSQPPPNIAKPKP